MDKTIILVNETLDNRPAPFMPELLGFASSLGLARESAALVLPGQSFSMQAEKAARQGIDVFAVESEGLLYHNPPCLAREVARIVRALGAACVCLPHTMQSCAAAAALSVELQWPLVTAVEGAERGAGAVSLWRSAYNGKIRETHSVQGPFVCTVQTGAFTCEEPAESKTGNVIYHKSSEVESGFVPLGLTGAEETGVSLSDAEVIVAAGRGIGSEENLGVIHETAGLFANSAVGASRVVCDNGWLPYAHQVGMTGKTVSPRLYLACGVSGSQQHIVGMNSSRFIVAINSDPHAAIFSVAHVCVVDDLTLFLPVFAAKCREARETG